MVRGVLELARRPVTSIMTHRSAVDWLDAAAPRETIHARLRTSPYRGFPVGRGSIDKLIGVARKEDLLALCLRDEPFTIDRVLMQPVAVPAGTTVLGALELFKRSPIELAIVVDEFGGVEGVVTRTDLLEAIAGDLPEHADEKPEIDELPGGALSLDGVLPRSDLQDRLRVDALPDGRYQTAAGMLLALLGRVPKRGDAVEWGGWTFKVDVMDGLSIRRIVARRIERDE